MAIYYAILRYRTTGNSHRVEWPSATARAISIITLAGYVEVLEEGMSES